MSWTAGFRVRVAWPPASCSTPTAGGFRRFRNRVHPTSDLQAAAAVCCEVLAATLAERGEPNDVAKLLADADRLRAESGVTTPALLSDVVAVARSAACVAPGTDG